MNILYFTWSEINFSPVLKALEENGHNVIVYNGDYIAHYSLQNVAKLDSDFNDIINKHPIDFIFSINYFPFIANYSHENGILYLSWSFDCPHFTLYSDTILYPEVYIFHFDKLECKKLKEFGASNVFHMPLATSITDIDFLNEKQIMPYTPDISFVGRLYLGIPFDEIKSLPDYLHGFINGLMSSQHNLLSYDLITPCITDDILSKFQEYIDIPNEVGSFLTYRDFIVDIIQCKLSQIERIDALEMLRGNLNYSVHLFSDAPYDFKNHIIPHLPVDYDTSMHQVFNQSSINLNFTARTVPSGIIQRPLDVIADKGFLITSYSPEILDYFTNGEDIVYFENYNDLVILSEYYLEHEKQRKEIIENGLEVIKKHFTYNQRIEQIIECVF